MTRRRQDPQRNLCTYCDREATEEDHVPPRCLFTELPAGGLITVPSCRVCNGQASKDDEYFRMMLVFRHDVGQHPATKKLMPAIVRSLQHPRKRKLKAATLRNLHAAAIYTSAGLYLGHRGTYNVNLERLGRVASRTIRGLFFQELGRRLPMSYAVDAMEPSGPGDIGSLNAMRGLAHAALTGQRRDVGDVLVYHWQKAADDENTTVWLLEFFGAAAFVGLTIPADVRFRP